MESGQLWFGLQRGTQLHWGSLRGPDPRGLGDSRGGIPRPFLLGLHQVALNLQDPQIADPTFRNAKSNGKDGWKTLSYADLAHAHREGIRLQPAFGNVDADNPNLGAFRASGGKIIEWGGTADQLYPFQGVLQYYRRVAEAMGGYAAVQDFYRLYPIAGLGHCFGTSANGLPGVSPPADPFVPKFSAIIPTRPDQLFTLLVDWVESGKSPEMIELQNGKGTKRRPLCAYPARIAYKDGDRSNASSYSCH